MTWEGEAPAEPVLRMSRNELILAPFGSGVGGQTGHEAVIAKGRRMKKIVLVACCILFCMAWRTAAESEVTIKSLVLTGQVQGENVSFTVDVTVDAHKKEIGRAHV